MICTDTFRTLNTADGLTGVCALPYARGEALTFAGEVFSLLPMETIPNVLADRYASAAMRALWSPTGKILLERDLWLAVLRAQKDLGRPVPEAAFADYAAARETIDLEDIRAREAQTRHDVKARLESYNASAGHEWLHQGMTSRDLTENVEQLQVFRALHVVRQKAVAVLGRLAKQAETWAEVPMTARTHNVPAQLTTVGKRLAMFGEELRQAMAELDALLGRYPLRGLQGAVGTQMDVLTLFDGDTEKVAQLDRAVREHLGLPESLLAVGQVYPRGLDAQVVDTLVHLASGPASWAMTLRLMAGQGLGHEGFAKGQTGSSAMPHKRNARSSERIGGFMALLRGYSAMTAQLAGSQWNEGDVACSVVRRVALPDAFLAMDGLLETVLTILDQMELDRAALDAETARVLPYLASTTFLMEAVKAGAGRETAHAAIKEHSLAAKEAEDLLGRLADDARLPLDRAALEAILVRVAQQTGNAQGQVAAFVAAAQTVLASDPEAANYTPAPLL